MFSADDMMQVNIIIGSNPNVDPPGATRRRA